MTFPKDINPIKFAFAAVGVPLPRRAGEGGHLFMQRISGLLEIPVHTMDEAIIRFKAMTGEFERLFEHSRDRMLQIPGLLERVIGGCVEEACRTFGTAFNQEQDRAVEDWINDHLLVEQLDFAELFFPAMLRIHETMSLTADERERHRSLGEWCEELALRWPQEYDNALELMRPPVRELKQAEGVPLGQNPGLHRLAQITHQQDCAFQDERDGHMFSAVMHSIDAWSQAYEGPVNDACSFIFLVAFPPREGEGLRKLPRIKHGPNKANIFDEVVKWCGRVDLEFPFFESIRAVRNAKSHCSFLVRDQSVVFEQVDGSAVELSFEEILACSQFDIATAHSFFQAVEVGRVGALASQGCYDDAWARACRRIPNLRELVSGPLEFVSGEDI